MVLESPNASTKRDQEDCLGKTQKTWLQEMKLKINSSMNLIYNLVIYYLKNLNASQKFLLSPLFFHVKTFIDKGRC